MRRQIGIILLVLATAVAAFGDSDSRFTASGPSTTNNDDSCDVAALPAATLLLPYFDVDLQTPAGETTIFTITNVTQSPRIARVTLWTDWSYPVFTFDVFLTGYDVQPISLYDVLVRGLIAPPSGTSSERSPGLRSLDNDANVMLDISKCDEIPASIPAPILEELQDALTIGRTAKCGTARVGGTHDRAVGYATIDVVDSCDAVMPVDPRYFEEEILFDNVLVGDYQQIDVSRRFAQGGTLVHIRAIPEGGTADANTLTFDRTFYSRYQNGGTIDRRQPLPSRFAGRWIAGGIGAFNGSMKIWREGSTGASADCAVSANGANGIVEIVRFDEEENPTVRPPSCCCITCPPELPVTLPSSSRVAATDQELFPPNDSDAIAGWMYMNFADDSGDAPVEQSWAIVSMAAEGRYSIDFDATSFGNGCSPATLLTDEFGDGITIDPAPNDHNSRLTPLLATADNDDSCDVIVAPAATLLLPYFEVDLISQLEDTLFTITNVEQGPRIAHVTIWTDHAYPVLSFNVFLTGYDTQAISLFDVLSRGVMAPPGGTSSVTDVGRRSLENDENPLLDLLHCDNLAVVIPPSIVADVQRALTTGVVNACGPASRVGGTHVRATGYVTIDVVASCSTTMPVEGEYYTKELLYDNVLTGDYQHVNRDRDSAQSGTMVHIRAIPEGGVDREVRPNFARTFYSVFQNGGTSDRRQPLPSTFAARWIQQGATSFNTFLAMWREGASGSNTCVVTPNREMPVSDFVRFDEDENGYGFVCGPVLACPPITLPVASRHSVANTAIFPANPGGDIAGWMYMNLNHHRPGTASQSWVVVSMEAHERYSADFDAPALGNGCSPIVPVSADDGGPPAIGPPPNGNPQ